MSPIVARIVKPQENGKVVQNKIFIILFISDDNPIYERFQKDPGRAPAAPGTTQKDRRRVWFWLVYFFNFNALQYAYSIFFNAFHNEIFSVITILDSNTPSFSFWEFANSAV